MAGALPRSSTEWFCPKCSSDGEESLLLSLWAQEISVQLLCPGFPFWNKLSVYLQIFLASEQAQQAQEQLSWTHPAQKIRQSSGRAAAWVPLAQPSSGCHSGHHAKERRSKTIPNSFWREWMDKTATETRALCQTCPSQHSWGSSDGASEAFSSLTDHCGNGNGSPAVLAQQNLQADGTDALSAAQLPHSMTPQVPPTSNCLRPFPGPFSAGH